MDNKLSFNNHFIFSSGLNLTLVEELNIRYKDIKIKQHKHVNYLACILDETMSGERMALRVVKKINSRLKFLYQKKLLLHVTCRRLLCSALIQSDFVYAATSWYQNLTKKLEDKMQVT